MKTLFAILFLLFASSAWAANYYVATTGSDAANGAIGTPFLTPQKCADVAVAGDTCFFRTGTYAATSHGSTLVIDKSGSPGSPITFKAYPSEHPWVKCFLSGTTPIAKGHIHDFDGEGGIIINTNRHDIVIDGLKVGGAGGREGGDSELVNHPSCTIGIVVQGFNNKVFNSNVGYTWVHGISIYGGGHEIAYNIVHDTNQYNYPAFQVLWAVTFSEGGSWGSGINADSAPNIKVHHNFVIMNFGENISCQHSCGGGQFYNNVVADGFAAGLYCVDQCSNTQWYNNFAYVTHDYLFDAPCSPLGRFNPPTDNPTPGCKGSAAFWPPAFNFANEAACASNCSDPVVGNQIGPPITNILFFNNISVNYSAGIQGFSSSGYPQTDWSGILAYNNTTIGNFSESTTATGGIYFQDGAPGTPLARVTGEIRNNIILDRQGSPPISVIGTNCTGDCNGSVPQNHNITSTSTAGLVNWQFNALPRLWSDFTKGAPDVDVSTMTTDTFIATYAANFKPAAGSGAIDTGSTLAATFDLIATPRPQGAAWDIGAFEYLAATSNPNIIKTLTPSSGPVTTSVTIAGTGFGATQGGSTVKFNGTTATSITSWADTQIIAVVPAGATTGSVVVNVSAVDSNPVTFDVTVPSNIALKMEFDENTGTSISDSGGNANNGTCSGTCNWTTAGRVSNALLYNGTSTKVTVTDAATLHFTSGMTISVAVYLPNAHADNRPVIVKGQGAGSNEQWILYSSVAGGDFCAIAGQSLFAVLLNNAIYSWVCGPQLPLNRWVQLTGTFDGSLVKFYYDNVLQGIAPTVNIMLPTTGDVLLGADEYGAFFDGRMDRLQVLNYAQPPAPSGSFSGKVRLSGNVLLAKGPLTASQVMTGNLSLRDVQCSNTLGSPANTISVNFTPAGSNRTSILVAMWDNNSGQTNTSATVDGASATAVGTSSGVAAAAVKIWKLDAPAASTIVATANFSTVVNTSLCAYAFDNANGTEGFASTNGAGVTSGSFNVTTSSNNNIVIGGFASANAFPITGDFGETDNQRDYSQQVNSAIITAFKHKQAAGITPFVWTQNNTNGFNAAGVSVVSQ